MGKDIGMKHKQETGIAGGLVAVGLAVGTAAFGTFLARRHSGGNDDAPQFARRSNQAEHALVGRSVTIRKPASELFAFWRDFQNLPRFMENVEEIRQENDHFVWVIKAPAGQAVELRTQIVEEAKDEHIAWRTVRGSDIEAEGRVSFETAPGDRGTRVSLRLGYEAPGGPLGRGLAKLALREPEVQARHDLKRFKMLMETGEIATSAHRKSETREAKQQENA